MTHIQAVEDATFERDVLRVAGLVAVDFWAQWCAPCRIFTPVLDEVAGEYSSQLVVRSVNADENPVMAARYAVRSLPTTLFFRDGQLVHRIVGAIPKSRLRAEVDGLLAPATVANAAR